MAALAPPPPLPRRTLGSQGLEVSALGLGCMSLCAAYRGPMTEAEGIAVLHAAYERGITFFDTADVYSKHQNEVLVGKGLKNFPREKVQIATKFALSWEDGKMSVQGSPEYVRKSCEGSLQRLGVDYIDLYYQHRVDTTVPIEATVGEMKKLVEEGKVKYLGLSEASAKTIRRAHAVHPITAVQLEFSLWSRDVEEEIIPTCRELGIGIVAYSPLGRGFFSGKVFKELETRLVGSPRFTPDNLDHHKTIFTRIAALAQKHNCSPGQLALAWVSHQGLDVVPIPGTSRLPNLVENIGSLSVKLTDAELEEIAAAVPPSEVKGTRYSGELLTRTYQHSDTPELVTI